MARRPQANSDDHTPKAKAATAVFNPVGMVKANVTAPSGNTYEVKPREPFKIAADDVEWFFTSWDWAFRQHLCRAEDYHPTCGYNDVTVIDGKAKKSPVVLKQQDSTTFEPKPDEKKDEKPEPADEEKVEPEPTADEAPVTEADPKKE